MQLNFSSPHSSTSNSISASLNQMPLVFTSTNASRVGMLHQLLLIVLIYITKKYIHNEFKASEDYEDLLKELESYDDNSIVVINYDNMGYLGYSIDEFTSSDNIYIESKDSE